MSLNTDWLFNAFATMDKIFAMSDKIKVEILENPSLAADIKELYSLYEYRKNAKERIDNGYMERRIQDAKYRLSIMYDSMLAYYKHRLGISVDENIRNVSPDQLFICAKRDLEICYQDRDRDVEKLKIVNEKIKELETKFLNMQV